MIDSIKLNIAQQARNLGLRFDDSELIDVINGDYHFVFLRSIKAIRQVEMSDGTLINEEFNDPIIWIDYPSLDLMRCETDYERQVIRYSIPQPQIRILYPGLIRVLPRLMGK